MSAIKLPVEAERQFKDRELWMVRDAEEVRMAWNLRESEAKQISLALNLYEDFKKALSDAALILDDGSAEADDGPLLTRIRSLLARAETANETKPD